MTGARPVHPWRVLTVVIAIATVYNIARSTLLAEVDHLVWNIGTAMVIVMIAVTAGMRCEDLGLCRDRLAAGARLGGIAAAVISAGLVLAAATPVTRGWFDDDRVAVTAPAMLWSVLVVIPIGTVLAEELVFRGVIVGLLSQRLRPAATLVVSAIIFGLWHLAPAATDGASWTTLGGIMVATTIAGMSFTWLRLASSSLVAPIAAHLATNSIAFAVAWAWFGS